MSGLLRGAQALLGHLLLTLPLVPCDWDVPPPLPPKGIDNIPEANELFRQAMTFKDNGQSNDKVADQRQAELLLQQLLCYYPTSDKVSEAAYQLGDLYARVSFKKYARAAEYFERCFEWNRNTRLDARMRAARLYEKLNERARAIELYKEVTTHEIDDKRVEEAQRRLTELGRKK